MTDNEIIKALECCSNAEPCANCPYQKQCDETDLAEIALDLINRQQAEIERLQKSIELMKGSKCVYSYDGETLEYCTCSPCPVSKTKDQIKAEAVKEFAERLIKSSSSCVMVDGDREIPGTKSYTIPETGIDNLVKEMVGEER